MTISYKKNDNNDYTIKVNQSLIEIKRQLGKIDVTIKQLTRLAAV